MENRDIIITEYIGRQGMEELVSVNRDNINKHYSVAFLKNPHGKLLRNEDRRTPEEKAAAISGTLENASVPGDNEIFCSQIGEGGILRALWDMSVELNCGLKVDMMKVPIRQEVIELSEYLEVNPYELKGGNEVMLIAAEGGTGLCDRLERAGIAATIVGYTLPGKQKLLKIQDRIRYLDRPRIEAVRA